MWRRLFFSALMAIHLDGHRPSKNDPNATVRLFPANSSTARSEPNPGGQRPSGTRCRRATWCLSAPWAKRKEILEQQTVPARWIIQAVVEAIVRSLKLGSQRQSAKVVSRFDSALVLSMCSKSQVGRGRPACGFGINLKQITLLIPSIVPVNAH